MLAKVPSLRIILRCGIQIIIAQIRQRVKNRQRMRKTLNQKRMDRRNKTKRKLVRQNRSKQKIITI